MLLQHENATNWGYNSRETGSTTQAPDFSGSVFALRAVLIASEGSTSSASDADTLETHTNTRRSEIERLCMPIYMGANERATPAQRAWVHQGLTSIVRPTRMKGF